MQTIILNTLQHIYGIYVPTLLYAKELEKLEEDPSYIKKHAASHDAICLEPGINRIDIITLARLQKSRVFKGLVEKGDLKVDDVAANEAYQLKLNPKLKSSKEYLEAKEKVELELRNKAQQVEINTLKSDLQTVKEQMAEMLKLMKNKRSANDKNKPLEQEKTDDNPSNDQGAVS